VSSFLTELDTISKKDNFRLLNLAIIELIH